MITVDLQRSVKFNVFWAHFCKSHRKSPLPRSMIPVTGYGRILPETAFFSGAFLQAPAYFRPELHRTRKRENPTSSLYRILSESKRDPSGKSAGNQPEIHVSLRNLTGKVRIAAESQLKNTGFQGTLIKSLSIF